MASIEGKEGSQRDRKAARSRRGPRTLDGKRRSSKNSRAHGLLSREIVFSNEEDRLEFEQLRDGLREDLQPSGTLLEILFDDILTLTWKGKLALRFELRELNRAAETERVQVADEARPAKPRMPIYSDTDYRLERKLRLLKELQRNSATGVTGNWKDAVITAFDEDFYRLIGEWQPRNATSLLMLEMSVEKSKQFGIPLPGKRLTPEELKQAEENLTELQEPLRQQFLHKLLELETRHVEELMVTARGEVPGRKQSDPLDLFMRYETTIRRDFSRALDKYWKEKERLRS